MAAQRGKVGKGGQFVTPADPLRRLGLRASHSVVVEAGEGELRTRALQAMVARAQVLVRRYAPVGESLVDELIRERRAEAADEA